MASRAESGSRLTGALTAGMVRYRSYSAIGRRLSEGDDWQRLPSVTGVRMVERFADRGGSGASGRATAL
jgi:hypothetical protein